MSLILEKVGQSIGEYSSSLINYGYYLSQNEDKAQRLAYKAFLRYIKATDGHSNERRVILFKYLREEALKNKRLRKVADLKKEVLFLELCENFSREEIKSVLGLEGDYWDLPFEEYLTTIQAELKIQSLEKTKTFFMVKHSKLKPHYLEDYYRNLLIDYVCDYKVELSVRSLIVIGLLMVSVVICFHHYDKWKDTQSWSYMMAPMYQASEEYKQINENLDKLFYGEQTSPSNQLLTPLPDIQRPISTEQSRTCSLKSR